MKALQDPEPEVLPDGGKKNMMITYSSTPDMSHYIIHDIHELEFYIRLMQGMFSR
jgi:hypothetical protein